MAKKTSKKKNAAPGDFSNSPFKSLKGLSASVPVQPKKTPPPPGAQKNDAGMARDENPFADEMDFLGVQPLSGRSSEEEQLPGLKPEQAKKSRTESDQDLFLDALGRMETVFEDEWPEETSEKRAVPRRMKQVERGTLVPEAELDLHGLTTGEALSRVQFFLENAVFHNYQTVRIVTGKGLHSSDGPVLRQAVEQLLSSLRDKVAEWGTAPRRHGGDGALVVFLRWK